MTKDISEIIKDLQTWQDADDANRGYIILTTECVGGNETGKEFACSAGVNGREDIIMGVVSNAFEDDENPVGKVMKKGIMFQAVKSIMTRNAQDGSEVVETDLTRELRKDVDNKVS